MTLRLSLALALVCGCGGPSASSTTPATTSTTPSAETPPRAHSDGPGHVLPAARELLAALESPRSLPPVIGSLAEAIGPCGESGCVVTEVAALEPEGTVLMLSASQSEGETYAVLSRLIVPDDAAESASETIVGTYLAMEEDAAAFRDQLAVHDAPLATRLRGDLAHEERFEQRYPILVALSGPLSPWALYAETTVERGLGIYLVHREDDVVHELLRQPFPQISCDGGFPCVRRAEATPDEANEREICEDLARLCSIGLSIDEVFLLSEDRILLQGTLMGIFDGDNPVELILRLPEGLIGAP